MSDHRFRRLGALLAAALLLSACVPESRRSAYSACLHEHGAYLNSDRPQGAPPEGFVLDLLSVCMMSKGYTLNAQGGNACKSLRALTENGFTAGVPTTWLRSLID